MFFPPSRSVPFPHRLATFPHPAASQSLTCSVSNEGKYSERDSLIGDANKNDSKLTELNLPGSPNLPPRHYSQIPLAQITLAAVLGRPALLATKGETVSKIFSSGTRMKKYSGLTKLNLPTSQLLSFPSSPLRKIARAAVIGFVFIWG